MSTSNPADAMHLEVTAEPSELVRVRATVRPWLPRALTASGAAEDALLMLSELVALAIERNEGSLPVEIRLRHTHSILVAEVDAHVAAATALDLADRFNRGDEELGRVEVIGLLADRVHAGTGPRRVTYTCSFRFAV